MEKVMIIACGHYMDTCYGCPGEWRCLKAAAFGKGKFKEPSQVIWLLKCECPGRPLLSNINTAIKSARTKPDVIHFSSCMVDAKPGCPYFDMEEIAGMITKKFKIPVIMGTHSYV